ncbi:hypothetical protein P43SY_004834 [Pythium insidiosum]|uniref:Uncharacterized protein n=1 Tax=Pythium insidiosum TaxID=114742 RepID=A0AAD5M6H9_PYTIN|nr:hypothetical protein P43SY_004834 [Pythium insidiosum]
MFAKRASKSKKANKRRRDDESDDNAASTSREDHAENGIGGSAAEEDDEIVTPIVTQRRKINTFSTAGAARAKNVLAAAQQIDSERQLVPQKYAGDATYESQIDTEKDRDARAILERNLKVNEDGTADAESGKVYRGQAAYKNYIKKNEAQIGMNKYTGTQGPIRAQTWARSICRFDYQPDICKDYKETGFCGYGDSCKFLHDRGDYKSGWQIEREYEEKERKRQQRLKQGLDASAARAAGGGDDDDDDDDDKYVIHSDEEDEDAGGQFACTICREPFRNAVETLCGHFFCEQCALRHFKKSSRCFNCRKQTNGIFQVAEKLRQREREQREAEAEAEAEAQEEEALPRGHEDQENTDSA